LESLTIPSSVVSIGLSAFAGCIKLKHIKYDGVTNPCSDTGAYDTLEGCESLQYMCLPIDYVDKKFCNRINYCKTADICEDIHFDGNQCYEEVCKEGKKMMEIV